MSQEELKQRALKITEALYRTTDLFSDAEPLKWSLRNEALEILNMHPQNFVRFDGLIKNISLKLDLASSGTFISKTNFEVIKGAYNDLLDRAMSIKDNCQNLLDPPIAIAMRRASNILSDKKIEAVSDNNKAVSANMTDRREALISALKQKGSSSVGELAKMLDASISEKTVQRELGVLVASGDVKQEG